MQLHPTRSSFHVTVAGAGLLALGAAARLAPVVAFGGAMLLAVALGRAIALVAVTRLRSAGFEMVWSGPSRVQRLALGGRVVLEAELRNRGRDPVRCVSLRALASTMLSVEVEPRSVDVPAGARVRIEVAVAAKRVGRWGLHGVSLVVRGTPLGGEGLFEVPLIFANPVGVEVVPSSLAALVSSPRGGRARRSSEDGRRRNLPGEGDELRELRDHQPGDPFKRIAWKASAKRGRLLVREMERAERELVWLVVDASVELWAGAPGHAPLDHVVEDVASVAARHLRRGDHVGLVVGASRLRSWIAPDEGPGQAALIAAALASAASCVDADRSDLDEHQVAERVVEHARPLDAGTLSDGGKGDLDALAQLADRLRPRAPFAPRNPFAPTAREQSLRHYLAAFGIESPPRPAGERQLAEVTLGQVLDRIAIEKPRASAVHVWAPAPAGVEPTGKAVASLRRRRIDLVWTLPPYDAGIGAGSDPRSAVAEVTDEAVRIRARAAQARGERMLRRLGVRIQARVPRRRATAPAAAAEAAP